MLGYMKDYGATLLKQNAAAGQVSGSNELNTRVYLTIIILPMFFCGGSKPLKPSGNGNGYDGYGKGNAMGPNIVQEVVCNYLSTTTNYRGF